MRFHGLTLFLFTTAFTWGIQDARADRYANYPFSFYIQASTTPIAVQGMEDVHISDWQRFGTGSEEGRVALNLSEGNTENPALPGGRGGASLSLAPFLDVVLEVAAHVGKLQVFSGSGGVDLYFLRQKSFRLGGFVRLGFLTATLDLGNLELIEGKTSPVIVDGVGNFSSDDTFSADLSGFLTQAGLSGEYYFTKQLGIRFDAGIQYALLNKFVIASGVGEGRVELPVDHAAVVKPTLGSKTQAGISPEGVSLGLSAGVGVVWRY